MFKTRNAKSSITLRVSLAHGMWTAHVHERDQDKDQVPRLVAREEVQEAPGRQRSSSLRRRSAPSGLTVEDDPVGNVVSR